MRNAFMGILALILLAGTPAFGETENFESDETIQIDQLEEPVEVQRKQVRPYRLFLKAGYQYDDNVRLEPLDVDIFADDEDYFFEGFFYGRYDFLDDGTTTVGAGYSHYQTLYQDLEEFDITGSIGRFYARYDMEPFEFGLSYLPAFFWVNSESYLLRHQVRPEASWNPSDDLSLKMTYSYFNDDYRRERDDDRDGDIHEVFLNVSKVLLKKTLYATGGVGYGDNSAETDEESYDQISAKLGLYATLPLDLRLGLNGKYRRRSYGESAAGLEREDDKLTLGVSLSSQLYYEWLSIIAEYEFTQNESDMETFDYERHVGGLSLALKF